MLVDQQSRLKIVSPYFSSYYCWRPLYSNYSRKTHC